MKGLGCVGSLFVLSILFLLLSDGCKPTTWYAGLGGVVLSVAYIVRTGNAVVDAELRRKGVRRWRSYLASGIVSSVLAGLLGFCVSVSSVLQENQTKNQNWSYPEVLCSCLHQPGADCDDEVTAFSAGILLLVLPTGFLAGLGYCWFRAKGALDE